ncbi:hypothetical protein RND81_07G152300 [Saponaria officinalis]|uniref:Uncharacterized protein n=1 Tax=Saponaria officinalis TaxID=3572 RepID=A0AAW1JS29_SAPOF
MATKMLIVPLLFSCFAGVCLSYNFAHQNPIRLPSDPPHGGFLDHLLFPRDGINAIYQFGDSISDTGNLVRADPSSTNCGSWPYGQTFFHKPCGRCSDGLLIIDFFAKYMNIPMIDAYLNKEGNFTHGVNFAVAGATGLDISVLQEKYNISAPTKLSLSVQLQWFKSHLQSFYPNISERRIKLAKELFFMGEVRGNDYNFAFFQGIPLPNVYKMVPLVEIIDLGATQIVIPDNFPIGCMPVYLTLFKTNDITMYDEMKCLKEYNGHAQYHNDLLQQTIIELQNDHPNITIIYMDYFGALKEILQHATLLGFDETVTQMACCGVHDNEYNVKMDVYCGFDGSFVCENPQEHISWDGTHLTHQAYHVMAKKLIPSLLDALHKVT